jgi:tRNA pseudouridine32 synthase/23S rRNA pseudouridine746 synthase/23S rRNA pseudouridine1911/1915/1917 synthase
MRRREAPSRGFLPKGLAILYEDRDILVVDKPPGLLTMGTDTDRTRTAYFILTDYVRKGQDKSRRRIFIVHRLDRETSGVLLFAKSEAAKFRLQDQWQETRKKYFAVAHGTFDKTSAMIETYLAENRAHVVYSTRDARRGRLSKTSYRVLEQAKHFALLEIDLLTGRKHQIRVHLADIGHPVVGDKKYGREERGDTRLALHAKSIAFTHPFDGQPLTIETPLPPAFRALMRAGDARQSTRGSHAPRARRSPLR